MGSAVILGETGTEGDIGEAVTEGGVVEADTEGGVVEAGTEGGDEEADFEGDIDEEGTGACAAAATEGELVWWCVEREEPAL